MKSRQQKAHNRSISPSKQLLALINRTVSQTNPNPNLITESTMAEQARTLTLDGVQYAVDQFSPGVQQAVEIYNGFAADLQKEQLAVLKTQSAMQSVGNQISGAVKKELDEKKAAAEAAAAAPAEGEISMNANPAAAV